jgi:hypothetical protein
MTRILSDTPISIDDVVSENAELLGLVKEGVREGLRRIARELPPGFHEEMRQALLEVTFRANGFHKSALRVKLLIDSNIIIAEAFRVAKGKPSTTERVLSSPFVEVFAPRLVWEEVEREIRKDLPKGASLERALAHAKRLLDLVKEVSQAASWALDRPDLPAI